MSIHSVEAQDEAVAYAVLRASHDAAVRSMCACLVSSVALVVVSAAYTFAPSQALGIAGVVLAVTTAGSGVMAVSVHIGEIFRARREDGQAPLLPV